MMGAMGACSNCERWRSVSMVKTRGEGRNSCAEGVRSAAFHVTFGVLFMHFSKMYLSRLYAVC